METPQNLEGALTERIMWAIRDHIKRDPPPQDSHHYNRAYEAVYRVLSDACLDLAVRPQEPKP